MGFFKDLSNSLGFTKADAETVDPEAYSDLYQKALAELEGVGRNTASSTNKDLINSTLQGQLENLDNNAAGRKMNYMEDMSRGHASEVNNIARATGGTGTLKQALRTGGGAANDQYQRNTSRGLNDLYSQATKDLSSLQGVQGNMFNQDLNKANSVANIYQTELNSRRGQANTNSDNRNNVAQNQGNLLAGTIGAGAQMFGAKKAKA